MTNIKLGICPIGWTNDDMPDLGKENTFQQCVSEMALAGFTGCEMGGKFPKDVDVLKKALALRGLSVASAWFSSFLTTKPYEETAEAFKAHRDFLHAMGAKVVVVSEQGNSIQGQLSTPLFANKPHNTDEEWKLVSEGLNKLGALAAEKDMKLVYHHHMGTGVQTEAEIDKLMEMTDPNLVFLLYDTGHLVCSGEDYIGILKKYINRIKHVHLKDVRKELVEKVNVELKRQMAYLSRKEIIEESLQNYGGAILVKDLKEAFEVSNYLAPEHLEVLVENPVNTLPYIKNAGSIFLGEYSPEPLGDYMSGTNHVLPTGGTAKFYSALGVYDFVKYSSYSYYPKGVLETFKDDVQTFAKSEGLDAHANSIAVRFEEE